MVLNEGHELSNDNMTSNKKNLGVFDQVPMTTDELQEVKSSSLASPVSLEMPLSEQREPGSGKDLGVMASSARPKRP